MTKNNNSIDAQKRLQKIIKTALKNVLDDYETLFAEQRQMPLSAETLSEKHKQGKIILSHIETLIKLTQAYSDTNKHNDKQYHDTLISEARKSLKTYNSNKQQ